MKFFVLTALYGRPEIAEICFRGIDRLRESHDLGALAVYSGDFKRLCRKHDVIGYSYKNLPLGEKWNAGLSEALKHRWDYLVTLGSDDLIATEWLNRDFGEATGLNRCGLIEVETGRRAIFENPYCLGVGRVIRRDTIESIGHQVKIRFIKPVTGPDGTFSARRDVVISKRFAERFRDSADVVEEINEGARLWSDDLNKGLDHSSDVKLNAHGVKQKLIMSDQILAIDLKSRQNIWPFDQYPIKNWTVDWLSKEEEDAIGRLKTTVNN